MKRVISTLVKTLLPPMSKLSLALKLLDHTQLSDITRHVSKNVHQNIEIS